MTTRRSTRSSRLEREGTLHVSLLRTLKTPSDAETTRTIASYRSEPFLTEVVCVRRRMVNEGLDLQLRQPPPQVRLDRAPDQKRTTETAGRACSSRAMRYLPVQGRSDTELRGKPTKSLRILFHRTRSPAIAHAGDRVLPAHGSLSQGCRVWRVSPCPHCTTMGWGSVDGNASFGHFSIPENLP